MPLHVEPESRYVLLTPDLTIVEASEDYRIATLLWREDVRDLSMFDVFPDNPSDPAATGSTNLRASLENVLAHGIPDRMEIQRYDVRDHIAESRDWVEKYWLPINSPVFGSGSNEIICVTHQVTDVTQSVLLRHWIDEETIVLREQCDTLRRMLADLTKRQQFLEAHRTQLLLDPAPSGSSFSQLQTGLHAPDHRRYLHAGEHAAHSGIYDMLHFQGCQLAPTRIFVRQGHHFPQCPNCRRRVLFRLFKRSE